MDNPEINQPTWNEPFFKERTNGKCLSVSISFIANRFLKIIQLALPVLLVTSTLLSLLMFLFCNPEKETMCGSSLYLKIVVAVILSLVFALLVAFTYRCVDISIEEFDIYSIKYKYLYNSFFKKYVLESFLVFLLFSIFTTVCFLLPDCCNNIIDHLRENGHLDSDNGIVPLLMYGIPLIIFILIIIPLPMVLNVVLIEKNTFFHDIKKGYLYGWKKWGRIFALVLMVGSIAALICLIVLAPAYVIFLMQHAESLSKMQGDTVNMPSFMPIVNVAIMFISSFVISIISIAVILPFAFLYAATKTAESNEKSLTGKS